MIILPAAVLDCADDLHRDDPAVAVVRDVEDPFEDGVTYWASASTVVEVEAAAAAVEQRWERFDLDQTANQFDSFRRLEGKEGAIF